MLTAKDVQELRTGLSSEMKIVLLHGGKYLFQREKKYRFVNWPPANVFAKIVYFILIFIDRSYVEYCF